MTHRRNISTTITQKVYTAQIKEMMGLYEIAPLNVYKFIDFPRSQKSSTELS